MKQSLLVTSILALLLLFNPGCAVTPYQPYSGHFSNLPFGGYEEVELDAGVYQLTIEVSLLTPTNTLVSYYTRRARELCRLMYVEPIFVWTQYNDDYTKVTGLIQCKNH